MGFEDVPSQKRNIALLNLMKTVGLLGSKAPSKVTLFFFLICEIFTVYESSFTKFSLKVTGHFPYISFSSDSEIPFCGTQGAEKS